MNATQTPYSDWYIAAPTTRRVYCELTIPAAFDEPDECRRVVVLEDSCGDNHLFICPGTDGEWERLRSARAAGALVWPHSRFGSWARLVETVEWARTVFALLGWRPDASEIAVFAGFGTMLAEAPARCLPKVA